jgi:signal transduction histidine kinase
VIKERRKNLEEKVKEFHTRHTIVFYAIIGGSIGYFFLHPFMLLFAHYIPFGPEASTEAAHFPQFTEGLQIIKGAFAPNRIIWGIISAFFGLTIGAYYGSNINRLNKEKMKVEETKEELEHSYKNLRKATVKLLDIDRLKNDIITNVSHELKTPVTIIKGAIHLSREENPSENQKKLLKMMSNSMSRLIEIIDNLISGVDIEMGAHELTLENMSLDECISSVVEDLDEQAGKRNVVIESFIPKEVSPIRANKKALRRVFYNILGNAIKFSKDDGGVVNISAEKNNDSVLINISDTGIGIPEDEFDEIFTPLHQIDATTKRKYGGIGLGLTVARSIITLHGGNIWADSKLGEGTTFHITLPTDHALGPKKSI